MNTVRHGSRYVWIGLTIVLLACLSTSQSTPKPDSKSTGVVPTTEGNSSSEDGFPRTPDPITVHATLDPEQAASNAESAKSDPGGVHLVDGKTTAGIKFSLMISDMLLTRNTDGDLEPALGTVVTVTPVSAIDDIPFSQGYLAAVHIAPDGLMIVSPASLSLTIPGDYDAARLIGFAADGTGEDFHLFPITVESSDGITYAYFSVTHFSLYGVALATLQEIEAQAGHPPVKPASQDEQELAPLLPLVDPYSEEPSPLKSKIQLQLLKSYTRLVKGNLDGLSSIPCNKVSVVAYDFNDWRAKVDRANETEHFQQQIQQDAATLLSRLTTCAKIDCEACLKNAPGNKLGKKTANSLLTLASFAAEMARILERMDEVSYWMQLSSKCNDEAGLPPLYFSTGGDCEGAQCQTSEPLICKE